MKLTKKKKPESELPKKITTVTAVGIGVVKITHHQSIRQSLNYQSAEASYGIEIHCADDDDEIESTIARAEVTIEGALLVKFREQGKVLNQLAKGR